MYQEGKPEAECMLWKVQISFSPVFDFGMDQVPCQRGRKNNWLSWPFSPITYHL